MATTLNVRPPQQYNQSSRKGKKAWRKHVDVSTVENGLEDVREQIIGGGLLADRPAETLFTLDATGSADIQNAYNKKHKPLKSDQILAERSAIPSLITHSLSRQGNTNEADTRRKRRRLEGVKPAEYTRLREVAYGGKAVQDVLEGSHAAVHDVWETADAHTEQDPRFDYLEKAKPVRMPPSLKEPSTSLIANGRVLPAVPKPKEGTSYNPVFEEWNRLLAVEGDKAIAEEQRQLRIAQADKELAERVEAAAAEAERDTGHLIEEESVWEGVESEGENLESLRAKRPTRKTPTERKRATRLKERHRQEVMARREKDRLTNEKRLDSIISKLKLKPNSANLQLARDMAAAAEQAEEVDDSRLRRKRFGKDPVPSAPLELVLPDELQESLRLLKPEGNLLQDRFRNLLVRGKMETRKPISQAKKRKRTQTEKWTHKDFQVVY